MEAIRRKHEQYEWNIKALLIYTGLWIETHPILKSILAFTAFSTNFLLALAVLNFCIHNASNIIILTKGMSLLLSTLTVCLKVSI